MTKKDYVALAKLLEQFREQFKPAQSVCDRELIVPLTHILKADNPNFDYGRFLAACGVDRETV